jgi:hypothetical protein
MGFGELADGLERDLHRRCLAQVGRGQAAAAPITGSIRALRAVPATFECSLDDGAPAPCTSPHQIDGLGEGLHQLAVVAIDLAGNADPSAELAVWEIDRDLPGLVIDSGPSERSNLGSVTFTFSADEAVGFGCALDGATPAPCTTASATEGSFTASIAADGDHDFLVRATDAAGNSVDQIASFEIDRSPPSLSVSTPATPTASTSVLLTWTSEAASYTCRLDGGTTFGCGAGTSGSRSFTSLGNGDHTFTISATDDLGNVAVVTRTVRVDTVTPTLSFNGTPQQFYTQTMTVNWSSNETVAFTCTLRRLDDDTILDGPEPCGSGTTGSRSFGGAVPSATYVTHEITGTDAVGHARTIQHVFCRGTETSCGVPELTAP